MSSIHVINAIAVRISPPEDEQKDWSYKLGTLWPSDQPKVIAFTTKAVTCRHGSLERRLSPSRQ